MVDYQVVKEQLSSPELGDYISYGIHGFRVCRGQCVEACQVSDISCDKRLVSHLANECIVFQLSPVHLMDVVQDCLP